MVDRVVVVCKKNTTTTISTTRYTTTMRGKLNKLFLSKPSRKILKKIIELEAFTTFTLQSLLGLTSTQIYPVLRFLQEFEVIHRHTKIRGRAAPPTIVFLLDGADESKVPHAISRHFDLMPRNTVKSMEYYVDPTIVDSLIMKVENSRFDKTVRRMEILKFAKTIPKDINYDVIQATMNHFEERGWRVIL